MKEMTLVSLWIAGALGTTVGPFEGLDARPEALVTGGVLLMLAAVLRRGHRAKATSGNEMEVLSAGQ